MNVGSGRAGPSIDFVQVDRGALTELVMLERTPWSDSQQQGFHLQQLPALASPGTSAGHFTS